MTQIVKVAGDTAAYSTVVATLAGWLPPIAALFTIIWLSIQISEKVTGKPFRDILCAFWHACAACVHARHSVGEWLRRVRDALRRPPRN